MAERRARSGNAGALERARQFLGRGRPGDAAALLAEVARDGEDPAAAHLLAAALAQTGDWQGAAEALRAAVAKHPDAAPCHALLGVALSLGDETEGAEAAFRRALELQPRNADAWGNLGLLLRRAGRHDEALAALERAVALGARGPAVINACGLECFELGRLAEAERAFRLCLERQPGNASALANLGRIAAARDDAAAAETLWQKAAEAAPALAEPHVYRCSHAMARGDVAAAQAAAAAALEREPGHPRALFYQAHMEGGNETTPDFAGIADRAEAALAGDALDADGRVLLHFAAGRALDRCEAWDRAFAHYQEGNGLVWAQSPMDAGIYDEVADPILEVFDAGLFETLRPVMERAPGGDEPGDDRLGEGLVFIVGMPRSGTTLAEHILGRDPCVRTLGETTHVEDIARGLAAELGLEQPFPYSARGLTPAAAAAVAGRHHRMLGELGAVGAPGVVFTDKTTRNFMLLGLMALLFPRARFVHCMRDPLDTCLSCYFQLFARNSIKYAYDLQTLGHFYGVYRRMMAHWHAVLPVPVLDLGYEALVEAPEAESRRLVDFCGFHWNDRFLDPAANDRAVRTASVAQVRRPIYRSSRGRWRHYERFLGPLMDELGDADTRSG